MGEAKGKKLVKSQKSKAFFHSTNTLYEAVAELEIPTIVILAKEIVAELKKGRHSERKRESKHVFFKGTSINA